MVCECMLRDGDKVVTCLARLYALMLIFSSCILVSSCASRPKRGVSPSPACTIEASELAGDIRTQLASSQVDPDQLGRIALQVFQSERPLSMDVLHAASGASPAHRAAVAVALFTSYVGSDFDPALLPVVREMMALQEYDDGALVIVLGDVRLEQHSEDVKTGEHRVVDEDGKTYRVESYEHHDAGRIVLHPIETRTKVPGPMVLVDERYLQRQGRVVMLGNYTTSETASRSSLARNAFGHTAGYGEARLTAFVPEEQGYLTLRCSEWRDSLDYMRSVG